MTAREQAPARHRRAGLLGRRPECTVLDELVGGLRSVSGDGGDRALVLTGPAGIGKSALLAHAVASAGPDVRVLRVRGLEAERELPYAGLHQLCLPVLERLGDLPAPQRGALETVFGTRVGPAPDRLVVGLAVLSLLSQASQECPLLCVVDDAHRLDPVSAQVLGVLGRRLLAHPIALLVGTRALGEHLRGLPALVVGGLPDIDAQALLRSSAHLGRDERVRDRIVAEARGNPGALLALSRGAGSMQAAASGPGHTLDPPVEQTLLDRVHGLPARSRLLLLVAAADPVGDPALVRAAAESLGVTPAEPLADATDGLLAVDDHVTFRYPSARSAVYAAAAARDRRAVHRALAEATDRQVDPDRRAWHLAAAAVGPDEDVATELERCAHRAGTRGDLAAAAAFLQRAVALTQDASRRGDRALVAAGASLRAGDLDAARRTLDTACRGVSGDRLAARAARLRGEIALAAGRPDDAGPMLLDAAARLRASDPDLARETYLLAWGAAATTGDPEALGTVSRTVRALPTPAGTARPRDVLLEALTMLGTAAGASVVPLLRDTASALEGVAPNEVLTWGWVATAVCPVLWDEDLLLTLTARQARIARDAGALAELPRDLDAVAVATALTGDLATASGLVTEAVETAEAVGIPFVTGAAVHLAALQGDEQQTSALTAAVRERAGGNGPGTALTYWSSAVLFNGLARYEEAESAARASSASADPVLSAWALPELVEAACHRGDGEVAAEALERLLDVTKACDTEWAAGVCARCRALLSDGAAAQALYEEAVERLGRTRLRPELARAHLLHGEWLRRRGQRVAARIQLRAAGDLFLSIGMKAFAERTRRELLATGETLRQHPTEVAGAQELTPQQRQIALLVRDGLSNPEVGARLFLSPRTVEWHLRQIFGKLSISSRRQLRDVLPRTTDDRTPGPEPVRGRDSHRSATPGAPTGAGAMRQATP